MTERRHKRQLKNYLLDRSFQLKYAGLLLGVAAILSGSLGVLLWRTSRSLVAESALAVTRGQEAVALGKQVTAESRKVSDVVQMNIVKDPFYADNPELLEAFQADRKDADAKLLAQEQSLEANASRLAAQSLELERRERTIFYTLAGALGLLVLAMGLVGIVVTHRVAGPIFKMTRQLDTIAAGSWKMPQPLRKGDELASFFGAFERMVESLRARRERELELLGEGRHEELEAELKKVL